MRAAKLNADESRRVEYLRSLHILDTVPEAEFDDVTILASKICDTPIAVVSLVDSDRQWFKSKCGIQVQGTPRDISFCSHAIEKKSLLVVEDALKDERFHDNPLVTGDPHIRFYAGAPLITTDGLALGTLCVMDRKPRELTDAQIDSLMTLGRQVANMLQVKRVRNELAENISRRQFVEQALAASEQLAGATLDALAARIAILDDNCVILAVNKAWRSIADHASNGQTELHQGVDYLKLCDLAALTDPNSAVMAGGIRRVISGQIAEFNTEYSCHAARQKRWYSLHVTRFENAAPVRVVVAHEDITQRKLTENRANHESLHDALTGLPNRQLFADRVTQALERAKRNPQNHFAVMFIDLDRFKVINDSLGHAAGDFLLQTLGRRLRKCIRTSDSLSTTHKTAARMGGDEFTALLDGLKHPLDVTTVAERILQSFLAPVEFEGRQLFPTASIGIALGGGGKTYDSAEELLRDADIAMYRAKADGKNRYCIFDDTMHQSAVARLRLETDLRGAVARNQLRLFYQPIVSLESGRLEGLEALLRWNSRGQIVCPNDFIPIAEETGLILPIGRWVISEAIRQLKEWRQRNPHLAAITMSVNVSRKQIADPELVGCIFDSLSRHNVPPENFKVELTETTIIENGDLVREKLEDIRRLGVRVVMDDFGIGYSSLSCIHKFPIDFLKLDRTFILQLFENRNVEVVVNTVVKLAHDLGMPVVAEGLETVEQVAHLTRLGCDFGQGFHFSTPMPASEVEPYLSTFVPKLAA